MKCVSDCRLCKEYENKEDVIYETENLFITPSIGQIVEGYLLICSKEHHIAIGEFPDYLFPELETIIKKVKLILSKSYAPPLFFEHGPASNIKKGVAV